MSKMNKEERHQKKHTRVRQKVQGTKERPRLCVFRSLNHIYVQVIDDQAGKTLVAASSLDKEFRSKALRGGNLAGAKEVGQMIAQRAKEKGVTQVVFDRGGYLYHGRVKTLADGAREGGLQF